MTDDRGWISEVSENLNYVKHNDTDFDGFKEYQKVVDERFSKIELKREKAERISNLEKWDESLPDRWREAKLSLIEKPVIPKLIKALQENPSGSFFLNGASGAGKTFVAYALVRRMIGHGVVSTSQIKMVSESVLFNWASRGFQGQDQLGQLLNPNYKLYLFDGIGTLDEKESAKVASLWEQILDHIYTNDLIAIFTSADELDRFITNLSPSGETKLRTLVAKRTFTVESDGSVSSKKS
jgi:hypothetical protein